MSQDEFLGWVLVGCLALVMIAMAGAIAAASATIVWRALVDDGRKSRPRPAPIPRRGPFMWKSTTTYSKPPKVPEADGSKREADGR